MTLLHAWSRMYSFDYLRGTLPVTFHSVMSAEDVTKYSNGGMKVASLF